MSRRPKWNQVRAAARGKEQERVPNASSYPDDTSAARDSRLVCSSAGMGASLRRCVSRSSSNATDGCSASQCAGIGGVEGVGGQGEGGDWAPALEVVNPCSWRSVCLSSSGGGCVVPSSCSSPPPLLLLDTGAGAGGVSQRATPVVCEVGDVRVQPLDHAERVGLELALEALE